MTIKPDRVKQLRVHSFPCFTNDVAGREGYASDVGLDASRPPGPVDLT